ncbi:MAG: hypothetical protein F2641_00640, partial [Actinobacteria bacterium]|nr:hypothetical protein [Actinomycetota bacterium]
MTFRAFARRPIVWVTTSCIGVAGFVLPVTSLPSAARSAVSPTEQAISVSGVDQQGITESSVAMAAWGGDASVHALGLAQSSHAHDASDEEAMPLAPAIATKAIATDGFGLVAVTADSPMSPESRVLVRVREDGSWGRWEKLAISEHRPDPGSAEAVNARYGTEPLLTGEADGVQVRMDTPQGIEPANTQVVLLDNPVTQDDANLPDSGASSDPIATVEAGTVSAPMPTIITRAQWGADESLRKGSASYAPTIKAGFLHHTVTTNNYTPEQAAQQVRNLYAYFTKSLRYSDMAYNFIVDRFGRLYEGRAGGMDQAVVGGHTAGFNQDTFAVSALGNFQSATPAPDQLNAISDAVAQLFAWKLALNH